MVQNPIQNPCPYPIVLIVIEEKKGMAFTKQLLWVRNVTCIFSCNPVKGTILPIVKMGKLKSGKVISLDQGHLSVSSGYEVQTQISYHNGSFFQTLRYPLPMVQMST
jgi:hypothetical protein